MSVPNGQRGGSAYLYGSSTDDSIPNVHPNPAYVTGTYFTPKPADSISISLEFLRGVDAAHEWAEDNYSIGTIADAVIAEEVARLREEAAK